MGDLTKWESKSAKVNVIFPLVVVGITVLLIIILSSLKPTPMEVKKKTAKEDLSALEEEQEEDVDWENF